MCQPSVVSPSNKQSEKLIRVMCYFAGFRYRTEKGYTLTFRQSVLQNPATTTVLLSVCAECSGLQLTRSGPRIIQPVDPLRYWIDGMGFEAWRGKNFPHHPPEGHILMYNGYGSFFKGVKRPERTVDHQFPPSAAAPNKFAKDEEWVQKPHEETSLN